MGIFVWVTLILISYIVCSYNVVNLCHSYLYGNVYLQSENWVIVVYNVPLKRVLF